MSTMVSGSLKLPNGRAPDVFFKVSDASIQWNKGNISYECNILGGHILVEFLEGLEENEIDDEIFRLAKYIIDNIVLTQTVLQGVGLSYTVEYCWKGKSEIVAAIPDKAPDTGDIQVNHQEIFRLMGIFPLLRYAVRDFNQGLIDREDCPFFFYRAIETLAKLICHTTDDLEPKDWSNFHNKIGTSLSEMRELIELNKNHRHGIHKFFTKDQHLIMMRTVKHFLVKSIQFLYEDTVNLADGSNRPVSST